ncbi:MAG: hypothetical protein GY749_40605 [Desulfobacteraceae bacterium]|nr:hypothetical protein [Desulfobacteraceae bacterium]
MFQQLIKIIFNKYLWLLFLPLAVAWFMLTMRLEMRTDFAMSRQLHSVKRIWGGNLEQPMPSVRYKGFGSDVSALSRGQIHSSDISVKIQVDYRKKGLVYYTGYNADFTGKYTIKNPETEKIYLSFIFPYPMKQGEGMLRNVKLTVNNEEDIENTEYQQNLILWTGLLEPGQALEMLVQYEGRGLNHFIHGFEPGKQINNFNMKIDVLGASAVDYPVSTMTPTHTTATDKGRTLTWELDSVLTQLNLGVALPDRMNIARQISVMAQRAPVFFIMFLVSLGAVLVITGHPLNFIRISIISVAYFLFYPLFAYLSAYMNIIFSFAISFTVIGLMIFNYSRMIYNLKNAVAICTAYTFYLGITSIAALLPTYTGLILTIEGVVLLAITMHVLSSRRDISFSDLFGWSGGFFPTKKGQSTNGEK